MVGEGLLERESAAIDKSSIVGERSSNSQILAGLAIQGGPRINGHILKHGALVHDDSATEDVYIEMSTGADTCRDRGFHPDRIGEGDVGEWYSKILLRRTRVFHTVDQSINIRTGIVEHLQACPIADRVKNRSRPVNHLAGGEVPIRRYVVVGNARI